ncbi:MAG: VWA domain-containing protein, partial [Bryobacteraceae bacterium]
MCSSLRGLIYVVLAASLAIVELNAQSPPIADDEQSGPGPVQVATPAPSPTIQVNVDLVNVYFSVLAKKGGALIPNLNRQDFKIYEDGKQQKIERFSRETNLPLTLGLLIDVSASQDRLIDVERQAAAEFFSSVIRPKDEAFLISFGKETNLLQDYTNSPRQLTAAMRDLRGDGPGAVMTGGPIPNTGPVPSMGTPKGTL